MSHMLVEFKLKYLTSAMLALLLILVLPYSPFTVKPALATSSEYTATGVVYTKGSSLGGNYTCTYTSNNIYHISIAKIQRVYQYGYGWHWYNSLDMYYIVNVGKPGRALPNAAALEVDGEARTDKNTVDGKSVYFWIYNYTASSWLQMTSFLGTASDVSLTWSNQSNVLMQNFINDQGDVRLRWSFFTDADLEDFSILSVDYLCVKLTLNQFKWTYMVYVAADVPGLPSYADTAINLMEETGSSSQVAVIVQADWYDSADNRYFITKDTDSSITSPVLMTLMEPNMGDPNTLSDFLVWSMTSFPAVRYALIMWDHGHGWRELCYEYSGGSSQVDALNMTELKTALQDAQTQTGQSLNLVGFNACLMQMGEVAYQIRNYANIVVGSEMPMRADLGFDFKGDIYSLNDNPNMNESVLGTKIFEHARTFIARAEKSYLTTNTISVVNLTAMGDFASALNSLAYVLATKLDVFGSALYDIRENHAREMVADGGTLYDPSFIDLANFTEGLLTIDDYEIQTAASNLLSVISDHVVLLEYHDIPQMAPEGDFHGLAIYFPRTGWRPTYLEDEPQYSALDLSQQPFMSWHYFLDLYFA